MSEAVPEAEPASDKGEAGTSTPIAAVPVGLLSPPSERTLWLEVMAVLSVSVLPWFIAALVHLIAEPWHPPYWLGALNSTCHNLCVIFVVLYLIHRSGETWTTFGLDRPQLGDVGIALALVMAEFGLWFRLSSLLPESGHTGASRYPLAEHPLEQLLMVIKYLVGGFSEELVTRAYLITRLERLLASRFQAVVMSSLAFASYHIYYGFGGALLYLLLFGIVFGGFYILLRRLWAFALAHALINMYIDLQHAG